MTAKPTAEEKARVPHHLYDTVDLFTLDFNVNKYTQLAADVINQIHARGKLPIVVGGTNYYVESLLFKRDFILANSNEENNISDINHGFNKTLAIDKERFEALFREWTEKIDI